MVDGIVTGYFENHIYFNTLWSCQPAGRFAITIFLHFKVLCETELSVSMECQMESVHDQAVVSLGEIAAIQQRVQAAVAYRRPPTFFCGGPSSRPGRYLIRPSQINPR